MSNSYLTLAEAEALASTLPELAAWTAATDPQKNAALLQATSDIDVAMPYQGRKYEAQQQREFPRAATESGNGIAEVIWDLPDGETDPTVPPDVLTAVLYQADAILAGEREPRIAAQHDGVVYDLTGTLAESYKHNSGPGVKSGLSRRSWILMRRYRRQSGRLL